MEADCKIKDVDLIRNFVIANKIMVKFLTVKEMKVLYHQQGRPRSWSQIQNPAGFKFYLYFCQASCQKTFFDKYTFKWRDIC